MGNAEQGGNQPQRVLLVGGPKHGDWMNLPSEQTKYSFVGMKMLSPQRSWSDWPDSAEHVYTLDEKLTAAWRDCGGRFSVFSHEVLTTSPEHGGFNLYALRSAEKALQSAEKALQSAEDQAKKAFKCVTDQEEELDTLDKELEAARTAAAKADARLQDIRNQLEFVLRLSTVAATTTGKDYDSVLGP